jgi:isoquinoline 1-oxidoreductase
LPPEYEEEMELVGYDFGLKRRSFMQLLSTGLLLAVSVAPALAQRRGGSFGGTGARNIAARVHLGKDGTITVMTGKVEGGQGARAELTEAAAEELRVPVSRVQLIMADTGLVPDDGMTAGSGSTPRTVPAVRHGAAAAREALISFAAQRWSVDRSTIQVQDGKATRAGSQDILSYADFASDPDCAKSLDQAIPSNVALTTVTEWKVLGKPTQRPNGREIVTGVRQYPSDISRPGMLYGKVLRAPSYGAKLTAVDLGPAQAMKDVVAVRDDQFVGVAAPTRFLAEAALEAIAKTAKWETSPHPSSNELFDYLKKHSQGVPANPFADVLAQAKQALRQTYHIAYVQHAPLEPRAGVAEWADGKLTVWTGSQNPFGCRSELARAFHLGEDQVRVIVPDFGAGYGGKHTGEAGVEAARLAKAASRPVSLRWTRQEEFTWAYFRPAAVIQVEAGLDEKGSLTCWHFVNINAGGAGIETPYRIAKHKSDSVRADNAPLRPGSYRCLAATGNSFARESFMDELAAAAGADPLAFRLAHLDHPRLRPVLETVAQRFGWQERMKKKQPNVGIGLACGTEKGSYVAACVEVEVNPTSKVITVRRVCQVFDCGAILNPANLHSQVQGAIIMGLGPALREEIRFENGEILNPAFRKYQVPRFADLPELDIHLLNRPEHDSAGAGETPIIAVAPAIGNAVFQITGQRLRSMPMRLAES